MIKDSGDRTSFDTGAVRDMPVGKGRLDLMPLNAVCRLVYIFNVNANTPIIYGDNFSDYVLESLSGDYDNEPERFIDSIYNFLPYYWMNDINKCEHLNFCQTDVGCLYEILLDVSIHYEEGAIKYGENNWQKGIPIKSYVNSALRHYMKHMCRMTDECHNRAFIWNLLCAYWTARKEKEELESEIES